MLLIERRIVFLLQEIGILWVQDSVALARVEIGTGTAPTAFFRRFALDLA
jgi:hypothetical protein